MRRSGGGKAVIALPLLPYSGQDFSAARKSTVLDRAGGEWSGIRIQT